MSFDFISKYFPLPKFLKPPHIGVSFSDKNIKAIIFDKGNDDPFLESMIIPIEKGTIVSGSVANTDKLAQKISLIKEKFETPFVFFAIPDELAYVFSANVPVTKNSDARESIAFIIEENVPLSLNDTIFDFIPIKIEASSVDYTMSAVVSACVKKEVEKYIEAFRKAGLDPIGCIHESQAIANALTFKDVSENISIVHARENRVGIYLVKNGLVNFCTLRSISEGDYKKEFIDEYEKFVDYCSKYSNGPDQSIKSVFVCGEFEYAKKIVDAIIESPNYVSDVKLSNVWTNVLKIDKHVPDIPFEESLNLAGPIGATLSSIE